MSLATQPGYRKKELVTIQPLALEPDPRGEEWGNIWQPSGATMQVINRKLGAAESFGQGKRDQTYSYILYADYKRGTTFRVNEKMQVWHPEVSHRNQDGSIDVNTGMEVDSVVTYRRDGIAVLECHRNE